MPTKFSSTGVTPDFPLQEMHLELQRIRETDKKDITLKQYISETWEDMTPEQFYKQLDIDLKSVSIDKLLNTGEMSRWLLPEIIRDAIRIGLQYSPFFSRLVAAEETINGTGLTMPFMDYRNVDPDVLRMRDVNEGATIPMAEVVVWREKQVNIHKKARGLEQTYESIQFTPVDLAAIYFEELGARLGADMDRDLINIAFNGEQTDMSESAPVIGAATSGTLQYLDIARAWVRFKRIFRNPTVMLMSEADAITVLNMSQFQRIQYPGGVTLSGVTLNVNTPLPTSQDIYVHDAIPTGKIVFVDVARAFIQLTAQTLLTESERIIAKQVQDTFVSMISGFAVLFKDGRMVLDYTTSLTTNPGPAVLS